MLRGGWDVGYVGKWESTAKVAVWMLVFSNYGMIVTSHFHITMN